jgi:hypothetical protein
MVFAMAPYNLDGFRFPGFRLWGFTLFFSTLSGSSPSFYNHPFTLLPMVRGIATLYPGGSRDVSFLFPDRLFQYPQGFVEAPQEFREVICKEDHRLTFKAPGFPVFAFHNIEVEVSQAVFFNIEEVRPIL